MLIQVDTNIVACSIRRLEPVSSSVVLYMLCILFTSLLATCLTPLPLPLSPSLSRIYSCNYPPPLPPSLLFKIITNTNPQVVAMSLAWTTWQVGRSLIGVESTISHIPFFFGAKQLLQITLSVYPSVRSSVRPTVRLPRLSIITIFHMSWWGNNKIFAN